MFRSLIKAILKVIGTIIGYVLVILAVDFITDLLPWATHILLIVGIIGMIYVYYKENGKEK